MILKFRAWLKQEDGKFRELNPFRFIHMSHEGELYSDKDIIISQFTGLKDKNGKEIYENDYLEGEGINVWWVKWGSGKYILQNISTGDIIECNENNTQRQKVTGNSFENPREHKAMATDL